MNITGANELRLFLCGGLRDLDHRLSDWLGLEDKSLDQTTNVHDNVLDFLKMDLRGEIHLYKQTLLRGSC